MEVVRPDGPGVSKVSKIGNWYYFCNILIKSVAIAKVSILMQNIQIFVISSVFGFLRGICS